MAGLQLQQKINADHQHERLVFGAASNDCFSDLRWNCKVLLGWFARRMCNIKHISAHRRERDIKIDGFHVQRVKPVISLINGQKWEVYPACIGRSGQNWAESYESWNL